MITAETAVRLRYRVSALKQKSRYISLLALIRTVDCGVQMFLTGGGSQHTG